MKLPIILVMVIVLINGHVHHKKEDIKKESRTVEVLPTTPKGNHLKNHYGTKLPTNMYGPGVYAETVLIPNNIEPTNNHQFVYTGGEQDCRKTPYFMLCHHIRNCDLCTANPHCGWCEMSQSCQPGTEEYSACPKSCPGTYWVFNGRCGSSLGSGKFTNVAPESRTIINPEIQAPQVHLHSTNYHYGTIKTQRPIGFHLKKEKAQAHHYLTNQVTDHEVQVATPIIGEVQHPVTITQKMKHTVNLLNGQITDQPPERGFVGMNTIPDNANEKPIPSNLFP